MMVFLFWLPFTFFMMDVSGIPHEPGCYFFKDKEGNIIYIGKAKDLKKRVSSYFNKNGLTPKTEALVSRIWEIDHIVTDNEVEALILESNLIKKHKPKYNIDLKDSKRYAYLRLTNERFPRLVVARKITKGKFFGPFTTSAYRDYLLRFLKKEFRLRTCKRFPKKPCLRHHIGLCDAPCIGNISEDEYLEKMNNIEMILNGNIDPLTKMLKKKMVLCSKSKDYEKALSLRNLIASLEYLQEKQNMERQKKYDEDIINYVIKDNKAFLMVFNIHQGILTNKKEFEIDITDDFFEEFILQYYKDIPREIILPAQISDALSSYLSNLRGSKVNITVPKRGEKKHLLDLVKKNIEISFFASEKKLKDLKKKLKLQDNPNVIECFDISHLGGTMNVGSMVQFRGGRPDKSNYRRFKIQTVEGSDDVKSIGEVVRRRYRRLRDEKQDFPDLIVIDGGKGQLNRAFSELDQLGLKIPIISLAKRDEEVFFPGFRFPVSLDKKSVALKFLQEIRDEAHRFAITYNRMLRKKAIYEDEEQF